MNMLFAPKAGRGHGIGHLSRCLNLAGQVQGSALYLPKHTYPSVKDFLKKKAPETEILTVLPPEIRFDYIFLDGRGSSYDDLEFFSKYGTVVGIDEDGPHRCLFPFLIDILPGPRHGCIGNITDPRYSLPSGTTGSNHDRKPLLITFGGEDPHNLTAQVYNQIIKTNTLPPECISVVQGPLSRSVEVEEGTELIISPPSLADMFKNFETVITSYGLSAYEAACSGCGVILYNPTPYHEKLGRRSGFITTGKPQGGLNKLNNLLNNSGQIRARTLSVLKRFTAPDSVSWPVFIKSLNTSNKNNCCPACGEKWNISVYRDADKTYFQCSQCRLIYLLFFKQSTISYSDAYFFESYRKQYGKTYLEDFETIKQRSVNRLRIISGLLDTSEETKQLLDIGCAYGPFLSAAYESGFLPYGLDISSSAVSYVRNNLGFPAVQTDFFSFQAEETDFPDRFNAVTMWFVLEHFKLQEFALRKVKSLLKPGGVFAFSTPNGRGVSGRFSKRSFFKDSPEDHHIIADPHSAKHMLYSLGFKKVDIVITGHHPERFPVIGKNRLGRTAAAAGSRLFRLGDTFEVYARKGME